MFKGSKMSKITYCPCCGKVQKPKGELYVCQNSHVGPIGLTDKDNQAIVERRKLNRLHKAVSIDLQIGDDDGDQNGLFYRLTGVEGNFTLKTHMKVEKFNSVDEKFALKEMEDKRYYGSLYDVVRKIQTMELSKAQAATLPELLEVLSSINSNIEALAEAIFYVSTNQEQED
jgi:hypothetical protein